MDLRQNIKQVVTLYLMVILTIISCRPTSEIPDNSFDKVELLKSTLLQCGFQADTGFNVYREYSWVKTQIHGVTIQTREAHFFLLDTTCDSSMNCSEWVCSELNIKEQRYLPGADIVYSKENSDSLQLTRQPEILRGLGLGIKRKYLPKEFHFISKSLTIVLHDRYIILTFNMHPLCTNDTLLPERILESIRQGLSEGKKEIAEKKIQSLDSFEIVRNSKNSNEYLNNVSRNTTSNTSSNLDSSKKSSSGFDITSQPCAYHCTDLRAEPDSNNSIGYITLGVFDGNGSPISGAVCVLQNAKKLKSSNKTDSHGCVKWCRVYPDTYTVEIYYKNKKDTLTVPWDPLPIQHIIVLSKSSD